MEMTKQIKIIGSSIQDAKLLMDEVAEYLADKTLLEDKIAARKVNIALRLLRDAEWALYDMPPIYPEGYNPARNGQCTATEQPTAAARPDNNKSA